MSSITDYINKNEEFIFRNKCINFIYGRITSNALWRGDDVMDIGYWESWSEKDASTLIGIFDYNFEDCPDYNMINGDTNREKLLKLVKYIFYNIE